MMQRRLLSKRTHTPGRWGVDGRLGPLYERRRGLAFVQSAKIDRLGFFHMRLILLIFLSDWTVVPSG
jgi:hypothetical protein